MGVAIGTRVNILKGEFATHVGVVIDNNDSEYSNVLVNPLYVSNPYYVWLAQDGELTVIAPPAPKKLTPCYCDYSYHPKGC